MPKLTEKAIRSRLTDKTNLIMEKLLKMSLPTAYRFHIAHNIFLGCKDVKSNLIFNKLALSKKLYSICYVVNSALSSGIKGEKIYLE